MTKSAQQHAQDALGHLQRNDVDAALRSFGQVLTISPKDPQANFFVGMIAYQVGDLKKARTHLETAAPKAKNHPQTHLFLGATYRASGDLEKARLAIQKAISINPNDAEFHALLGEVFHQQHRAVMARQSFERALKLDAKNKGALLGLGQLEVSIGDIDAATDLFKRAIDGEGANALAYSRLAMASYHNERPDYLDDINKQIENASEISGNELAYLHWAAGKINYDLGDTQQANEHYRTARRTHYVPFNHDEHEERMAFVKEVFTSKFFEDRKDVANESEKPVFIFGMPRSGTTLIEQIVARHSKAASGGEQRFFIQTMKELGLMDRPSAELEQRLKSMDKRDYNRIARQYLKELEGVDKRAQRITDKMPHNFEALWLMSLLFPNATYVHTLRCPADTCVSLMTHALSPAHAYARTQESVGRYFQQYGGLMHHWEDNLPVQIYSQRYEGIVYDFDTEAKALLAAAGMEWEEECREFYRNKNLVTTFSDIQVRRPIFKSSVGRWRRQKEELQRLFEALGTYAPVEVGGKCDLSEQYRSETSYDAANDHRSTSKTA
ncbi:MAG: sulfotransferase [Rhodobacteraceae bacterium]|nr:sulfotransferase [Paracoccaceae bacterium]